MVGRTGHAPCRDFLVGVDIPRREDDNLEVCNWDWKQAERGVSWREALEVSKDGILTRDG